MQCLHMCCSAGLHWHSETGTWFKDPGRLCNWGRCVAGCCSHYVAVRFGVLQCDEVCCSVLQFDLSLSQGWAKENSLRLRVNILVSVFACGNLICYSSTVVVCCRMLQCSRSIIGNLALVFQSEACKDQDCFLIDLKVPCASLSTQLIRDMPSRTQFERQHLVTRESWFSPISSS